MVTSVVSLTLRMFKAVGQLDPKTLIPVDNTEPKLTSRGLNSRLLSARPQPTAGYRAVRLVDERVVRQSGGSCDVILR